MGKDDASRAWRKVKVDWDAWVTRSLNDEGIVRLILDGTVIKTRLDKRATIFSVLAAKRWPIWARPPRNRSPAASNAGGCRPSSRFWRC